MKEYYLNCAKVAGIIANSGNDPHYFVEWIEKISSIATWKEIDLEKATDEMLKRVFSKRTADPSNEPYYNEYGWTSRAICAKITRELEGE